MAAVEAFFGRALDHEIVSKAFSSITVPGRFEVVHRGPLVILDGAHNVDGAERTAADAVRGVRRRRPAGPRRRPARAAVNPREMLDALHSERADLVIACTPDSPRAIPADEIAAAARTVPVVVEIANDVGDAVEPGAVGGVRGRRRARQRLLYVAGAARAVLHDDHRSRRERTTAPTRRVPKSSAASVMWDRRFGDFGDPGDPGEPDELA